MARDYKPRTANKRKTRKQPKTAISWWRWLLIGVIVGLFVWFLFYLRSKPSQDSNTRITTAIEKPAPDRPLKKEPRVAPEAETRPRFEFYTILPESEVVVPEYELNTRKREEKVGKAKSTLYVIQAGSFKDFNQADKLKAQLALMGIESRIEKARVGDITWNRIKMGPFASLSNVDQLRRKLKQNNIDAVVMEISTP